jgi:2-C-methyl-D-erythritol 4-phosphate cytidylyltransferase
MSDAPKFCALVLTAAPPGETADSSGALVKLDGREVALRSVELFLNRPEFCQIALVTSQDAEEEIKRKLGGALSFMGVKLWVGGKKWSEQLATAAAKVSAEAKHVLVHDASRPVTPYGDIDAIIESAPGHQAISLAAPVRSPLVELDEGGGARAMHPSSAFMQLLTPQVFSRQRFSELASGKAIHASEWKLLKASGLNVRVGNAGDASLARAMMNLLPKPKAKAMNNPFEEAQW